MPLDLIGVVDFAAGVVAVGCLAYLLYAERVAVHYPRLFRTILVGLLVFSVTGPVIGLFAPALVHWVHAVAGAVVVIGCYQLVAGELAVEETDFAGLLRG